jgi:cellulose synthase operon protein C
MDFFLVKILHQKELRAEVLKAKGFRPRIREFFLVTTAPNDERIQEVARRITMEGQSSGRTFIVSVWGWDTLELEISQHDKALRAFHLGE